MVFYSIHQILLLNIYYKTIYVLFLQELNNIINQE